MTRIAIVSDAIFPYNKGGKETRIHQLTKRLAASGHDVHIYTMHWWDDPNPNRIEFGVHLHAISPLYPLYTGGRRSVPQGLLFGLAAFKLIRERFDVVDVDHIPYFPLFSVRLISWLKRRPMLATWHEVWGREYWQTYLGTGSGLVAYLVERLSVLLPDRIIAVSELTSSRLEEEFGVGHKTVLVQNGIDFITISRVRPKSAGADIVYAGRLLAHKNIDVLLRSVALLKRSRPGITCQIIGDGPERDNLETLVSQLNLGDNVEFTGFIPSSREMFAHLKAARVFALPSTREGFSLVFIEANACGLPVVTVNHPHNAARHLVTPVTGRLAKLSAISLARHINNLLTSAPTAAELQAAASSYDWHGSALKLSAEYSS